MRVLAAMSGGVDSAVAAARVLDAGHEVVGVHLALSREPATTRTGARGCCSLEDAHDARRVADVLGIPFYVWDLAERFDAAVVADFVAEYAVGRTPNPCVRCNERIKFSALLDKALALGFDAVCTGHYARLEPDPLGADPPGPDPLGPDPLGAGPLGAGPLGAGPLGPDPLGAGPLGAGEPRPGERPGMGPVVPAGPAVDPPQLHRASDREKDQSYVLAVLTPEQLAHALFPLGRVTKPQVRQEAADRGLRVAEKRDSHDICFIADGDTQGWLERRLGPRPGTIVDLDGRVLGEHGGTYGFTVGQRKGLRLGRPAADGRPRYVLEVRPATGTVVVGPREALQVTRLTAVGPRWCGLPPRVGDRVGVQIRAHGEEVPGAVLAVGDDAAATVQVVLDRPILGAAPGQTVALYDGSRVLGAATLTTPRSAEFQDTPQP